ncbi:hypothetical protein GTQ40_00350 [Flavobacteriaceae bacterium R38]|nr:hypothetical protein [Flavobacteriaceae bacterium R38]
MNQAEKLIQLLNLTPHPEGGYFKETYRSDGKINEDSLNNSYSGNRNYSTAIYFLLTSDQFSSFHKIHQDEAWHFYDGVPVKIHMISNNGDYSNVIVGRDFDKGEVPQFVVPGEYWFAAEVIENNSFSLVGCTVSPGFDFNDFKLAKREDLILKFPQHKEIITKFTR